MKYDKVRIANAIRSHYPKALGIRRALQQAKIKRVKGHLLPSDLVKRCEDNPGIIGESIAPYLERWRKPMIPINRELEEVLVKAPHYSDLKDKTSLRTDMLFCRLAYGFLPSEYAAFHFENLSTDQRKTFVSDTDTFVFGYSVNDIAVLQSIIDKGQSFERFREYFGRDAIVIDKESDFDKFHAFVAKHPVFVQKRTNSSMGHNIELVDIRKVNESEHDYFRRLISLQKHLLEERIVQHESMARLNPSSINTIRCMTFNTREGIKIPYCFMRNGRNGSFVDNGGMGGLIIAIDALSGVCLTDGCTEYGEQFPEHPDTHVVYKGLQIPAWEEMTRLCKSIAMKTPDIRFLSFDMAYTDKGWIVVEVNGIGQLIGPQLAFGRGIKREIEQYLNIMDKTY